MNAETMDKKMNETMDRSWAISMTWSTSELRSTSREVRGGRLVLGSPTMAGGTRTK